MRKSALKRHLSSVHLVKAKVFNCDFPCQRVFLRSDKLKQHKLTCKWRGKPEHLCTRCKEHIQGSMATHLGKNKCPRKFVCTECDMGFRTETAFGKHVHV